MLHHLRDGTPVRLRHIRADDKALLAQSHAHLSDESIRLRFLTAKPRLTRADLRYLTEVDGVDHVAIVATSLAAEGAGAILGVARFVRLDDEHDAAEMAITVGDAVQRRGLGTLLAEHLAEAARRRGIRRFTATAFDENVAVRRLMATISERLDRERTGGGVSEYVARLAA